MIGPLAAATAVRRQISQIELLHDMGQETSEMPLRRAVLLRRRQEPRRLTIRPAEIPRHLQTSSTIFSAGNTMH